MKKNCKLAYLAVGATELCSACARVVAAALVAVATHVRSRGATQLHVTQASVGILPHAIRTRALEAV